MKEMIFQLISGTVGSLGFSLIFNVGKKHLFPAALGGLLSWAIYLLCNRLFCMDMLISTILASACSQIYAEILARIFKSPTTVFFIPAVVPLIPGGTLYNTMYSAVFQDWTNFRSYGVNTLLTTLGISIGLSFVSAVLYILAKISYKKAMK